MFRVVADDYSQAARRPVIDVEYLHQPRRVEVRRALIALLCVIGFLVDIGHLAAIAVIYRIVQLAAIAVIATANASATDHRDVAARNGHGGEAEQVCPLIRFISGTGFYTLAVKPACTGYDTRTHH